MGNPLSKCMIAAACIVNPMIALAAQDGAQIRRLPPQSNEQENTAEMEEKRRLMDTVKDMAGNAWDWAGDNKALAAATLVAPLAVGTYYVGSNLYEDLTEKDSDQSQSGNAVDNQQSKTTADVAQDVGARRLITSDIKKAKENLSN